MPKKNRQVREGPHFPSPTGESQGVLFDTRGLVDRDKVVGPRGFNRERQNEVLNATSHVNFDNWGVSPDTHSFAPDSNAGWQRDPKVGAWARGSAKMTEALSRSTLSPTQMGHLKGVKVHTTENASAKFNGGDPPLGWHDMLEPGAVNLTAKDWKGDVNSPKDDFVLLHETGHAISQGERSPSYLRSKGLLDHMMEIKNGLTQGTISGREANRQAALLAVHRPVALAAEEATADRTAMTHLRTDRRDKSVQDPEDWTYGGGADIHDAVLGKGNHDHPGAHPAYDFVLSSRRTNDPNMAKYIAGRASGEHRAALDAALQEARDRPTLFGTPQERAMDAERSLVKRATSHMEEQRVKYLAPKNQSVSRG